MHCLQGQLFRLLIILLFLPVATTTQAHDPIKQMAVAAQHFLDTLDEKQVQQAVYEMSDQQQKNWHFLPDKFIKPDGRRYGLPIEQMSSDQSLLALALVNAGLSHNGYLTTMTVMSLEQVLHDLEDKNPIRNSHLYYLTIFGKPGNEQTWGWRFEGHHLSINFTIVNGKLVSVTPAFFGSNPAIIKQGPRKGLQTLRDEEQLARSLVNSLSDEQKRTAILNDEAPDDILTGEQREVDQTSFTPAQGIACANLSKEQQDTLLKLIKVYAEKFRPEIVDQINERTNLFELADLHFAWSGSLEQGQRHYYRVQTPKFLFEYDNTQNDANHVHAVWRDFEGDFGADLLRKHYDKHHAKKREP